MKSTTVVAAQKAPFVLPKAFIDKHRRTFDEQDNQLRMNINNNLPAYLNYHERFLINAIEDYKSDLTAAQEAKMQEILDSYQGMIIRNQKQLSHSISSAINLVIQETKTARQLMLNLVSA